MSKTSSKVKTAVTVILVIMLLILSLGLLARLTNVFGNKIAVTYNGTKITKDFEGLEIDSGTEIEVKAPGEYEVKIYAEGSAESDFSFTVDGREYSWWNQKSIERHLAGKRNRAAGGTTERRQIPNGNHERGQDAENRISDNSGRSGENRTLAGGDHFLNVRRQKA